MSTTITRLDGETTTPDIVNGYRAYVPSRNIVRDALDGSIVVTLIPPRPRNGTLELVYAGEADAAAAVDLHCAPTTFALNSTTRDSIDMTYVLDEGEIEIELDVAGMWRVRVPFQEVRP